MGHVQNCLYSSSVGLRLMALRGTEHWMTAGAVWCRWLATARKSLTDSDWVQKWPIMPDIVYKVLGYHIHFKHIYLPTRVICDWLLSATATGFFMNGLWCIVSRSLVVNTGSGPFVAQLCRAVTPLKVSSCMRGKGEHQSRIAISKNISIIFPLHMNSPKESA